MAIQERYLMADGNWLLHRAWSAAGSRSNYPTEKVPAMLLDWVCSYALKLRCIGGGIAFDGSENFRYEVYKDYKSNRGSGAAVPKLVDAGPFKGMPVQDAVYQSLKPTKDLFKKLGLFVTQQKRFEADDVMRSCGWKLGKGNVLIYLVSLDKDIIQAVTDNVHIYIPEVDRRPESILMPADVIAKKKGLTARQFLDLQILIGDEIDCVPPVPGMTRGKALAILKEHGGLSAFFKTKAGKDFYYSRATELHRNKELVQLSKLAFPYTKKDLLFSNLKGEFPSQSFTTLRGLQTSRSLF